LVTVPLLPQAGGLPLVYSPRLVNTLCTPEYLFHSQPQDTQYCSNDGLIQYAINIGMYLKRQGIKILLRRIEMRPVTNLPPAQKAKAGTDLHLIRPSYLCNEEGLVWKASPVYLSVCDLV
jgi:hypothetical protein